MSDYKLLTQRRIINKFFYYVKLVNSKKQYSPGSLTNKEYSRVKELLIVKLKMNDRQADFLLKQKYENCPLKEGLFKLEDIPINIEKFNNITMIRNIKNKAIGYLLLFIPFLVITIIWNFLMLFETPINVENLLIANFVGLPLGLFGIYTLVNYGFFDLKKYLDNDKIINVKGTPYKIKIRKCFITKSDRCLRVNEILYVILYFKNDKMKQKNIYLVEPDIFIWNKNNKENKIKKLKILLLNKKYDIDYYEKTKYIKNINININKIIKKIAH